VNQKDPALKSALAVLGLPETANRAEVTKAYRRLARVNHPDVSSASDAALRFEAIEDAYRHALRQVPAQADRSSAPSFGTSTRDQVRLIGVDRGSRPDFARPAIIAGPGWIERPAPREQPANTDDRGETHG